MRVLRVGDEYLARRERRAWIAVVLVATAVLAGTLIEGILAARSTVVIPVAILATAAILVSARNGARIVLSRLRAVRKGRLGERLTTELVRRLPDDYYLINDVAHDFGNIDHVVVGPCGIIVVETKRVVGDVSCDGDAWTVNRWKVKSYSKQVKKGAVMLKEFLAASQPELRREYIQAVVVLTDPHCRITINRASVGVVRFSELLPFIVELARRRQMDRRLVELVVSTLCGDSAEAAPALRSPVTVAASQRH